ncbi:MAG: glycosyltransferase family 4 protein [Leptolinea sp.]|jgi:glycosyltransferase involved in cell wall biosynthesis|nr:glycosyltransferase family 4 protein [Leptolinea sp.]
MRILYASRGFGVHDERFLRALSSSDHDVFFLPLTLQSTSGLALPVNVRQIYQPTEKEITPRTIGILLEKWTIDLVHAGPVNDVARVFAFSGFQPLVSMSWGFDLLWDAERDLMVWMAIKEALEHTTVFFCDAHSVETKAVNEYGFDPQRIVVFPWGVDHGLFFPTGARAGRSDGQPLQLFSNRAWEDQYGVDVLVDGLIRAGRTGMPFKAILAGDGSMKAALQEKIRRSNIAHQVQFVGRISQAELPYYYNEADVFISASHVDGSSLSLMEAMACGTVPLVSDIPSNKEWVEDSVSGYLFDDGDSVQLAARLLALDKVRHQLPEISRKAQAVAEERADWKKNRQIMLSGYDIAMKIHREQSA